MSAVVTPLLGEIVDVAGFDPRPGEPRIGERVIVLGTWGGSFELICVTEAGVIMSVGNLRVRIERPAGPWRIVQGSGLIESPEVLDGSARARMGLTGG